MDNALTVSTYPNTTRYCSQCGQPLPAGARFCPGCGTQVAGVAAGGVHAKAAEAEPVLVIDPPRRWKPVLAIAVAGAVVLALAAFYSMRQSSPQPAAPVATATSAPAPVNVLPREPKPGTVVMAPEHVASAATPVAVTPASKPAVPPKPTVAAAPDDSTSPPPAKVADSKPPTKRAPAPEKAAEKAAESSEQPSAQTAAADGDWHRKLQEELTACETGNMFKASFCKEKVRWHYCPHRWSSVPECTQPKRAGKDH